MENIDATLIEIVKRVLKATPIVILCVVLGGGLAYYNYQNSVRPTYTARATLMAICNGDTESLRQGYNNVSLAKDLLPSYLQILRTDEFLNKIIETTGLDYSTSEIKGMMSTSTVENTSFFKVYITSESEEDAMTILDAIVAEGPQHVYDVLKQGYFQKIDGSALPLHPEKPGKTRPILVGMIIGGVIPICIVILIALLDTSIRNEQQIERYYHLSVVGSIPTINGRSKR